MSHTGVQIRRRTAVLLLFVFLYLAFIIGRLAWLQLVRGDWLRRQAEELRQRRFPIEARRGMIVDRNGRPLAVSINVDSVFTMPANVKDPYGQAALLAPILGMKEQDVVARLTRNASFWWIKRKVSEGEAARVKALIAEGKLPGVYTTQEGKRVYPKGELLGQVLGITGIDSQGLEGLEKYYDAYLRGTPGQLEVEVTATGQEIPGAPKVYQESKDGNTLQLTIDENIQYIIERDLELNLQNRGAKAGAVIVMDVKTGEILGMAMKPGFDPNDFRSYPAERRRNWAISDVYPPGSVFKPVTAAAALQEGKVSAASRFSDPGFIVVTGTRIRDWKAGGHGDQNLADVIKNSCNIGFVLIGQRLGLDLFYKYLDLFGFRERTGIDLPGEASGLWLPKNKARPVDLAVMSFGQTVAVTPIQMIRAIAAIANGGLLLQPRIVKSILTPDGATVAEASFEPVRRVVSPEVARELTGYLEQVITEGTGRNAAVPGYRLAGKTGTAQKVEGGRIAQGKYIASFVGYGPVEDPRIAVLIVLDEPTGIYYGGQIAAPIFSTAMRDVLSYLEVPPSEPVPGAEGSGQAGQAVLVPQLLNLTPGEAWQAASDAGLTLQVTGPGPVIVDQFPAAGARVPKGTLVLAQAPAEDAIGEDLVTVPGVIGQSMAEVRNRLGLAGLRLRIEGSGLAVRQDPVAGSRVPRNTWVTVTFSPPPR